VNIPPARLRELAAHVFDVMEEFALALRAAGSEELAETFESYVRHARTLAASGRVGRVRSRASPGPGSRRA
jgi:hypothetical protein